MTGAAVPAATSIIHAPGHFGRGLSLSGTARGVAIRPTVPSMARPAPEASAHLRLPARVEVAWTVSAGALDDHAGYASAVLHLECAWNHADAAGPCTCSAALHQAGRSTTVAMARDATVHVERNGRWTHLRIDAAGTGPILRASFELGRLVYCTSAVPQAARLAGGTYDAPTGILELYEAPTNASLAASGWSYSIPK